jgi:hypothetical protein
MKNKIPISSNRDFIFKPFYLKSYCDIDIKKPLIPELGSTLNGNPALDYQLGQ